MPGPQLYVDYLTKEGYHPRSNKHGERLAQLVLMDLLTACPQLAHAGASGKVIYAADFDVSVSDPAVTAGLPPKALEDLVWNIDLAVGPASAQQESLDKPMEGSIQAGVPERPWFVLDSKGVMTEHGKARRNRQRDVTALSAVMHLFYPNVVVGAVIPVNIARKFRSQLRDTITDHGQHVDQVVADTVAIFRAVRSVSSKVGPGGIDGLGCFVIDFDSMPGSVARLHLAPPAPQPDDAIYYDRFINDLASALTQRYGSAMG